MHFVSLKKSAPDNNLRPMKSGSGYLNCTLRNKGKKTKENHSLLEIAIFIHFPYKSGATSDFSH